MNAAQLEAAYLNRIKRISCLLLLPAADAKQLVGDCARMDSVRLLGVEAYRTFDGGRVQPGIEFSNINFGQIERDGDNVRLKSFERDLREPWNTDRNVSENTQRLIDDGVANGYDWFEVSIEDVNTNELLFFRTYGDEQTDEREPE